MRIYFIIIASLILLGCSASRIRQPNSPSVPEGTGQGIPIPAVAEKPDDSGIPGVGTSEFLSAETRVKGILNFLASDGLEGRDSGSEGIEKAALFIEAAFRLNGIAPYFTSYRDTLPDYPKPAYNLVGYLEGTDEELKDEFIIIGAHYDHIGVIRPQVGDSIANGANDNASGTTTVLELMRYFGHSRSNKPPSPA
jgi:hypothetical protein